MYVSNIYHLESSVCFRVVHYLCVEVIGKLYLL